MLPRDTDLRADAAQRAAWQRMGPEGRLDLALDMSDVARDFALMGLRRRHPQWTEAELRRGLMRLPFPPDQVPSELR